MKNFKTPLVQQPISMRRCTDPRSSYFQDIGWRSKGSSVYKTLRMQSSILCRPGRHWISSLIYTSYLQNKQISRVHTVYGRREYVYILNLESLDIHWFPWTGNDMSVSIVVVADALVLKHHGISTTNTDFMSTMSHQFLDQIVSHYVKKMETWKTISVW